MRTLSFWVCYRDSHRKSSAAAHQQTIPSNDFSVSNLPGRIHILQWNDDQRKVALYRADYWIETISQPSKTLLSCFNEMQRKINLRFYLGFHSRVLDLVKLKRSYIFQVLLNILVKTTNLSKSTQSLLFTIGCCRLRWWCQHSAVNKKS